MEEAKLEVLADLVASGVILSHLIATEETIKDLKVQDALVDELLPELKAKVVQWQREYVEILETL